MSTVMRLKSSRERRVLFGIHIPKTAGSTFLKMSRRRFGQALFQNTSQVQNYLEGNCADLFSIVDPTSIRVAFGHHLYETSLQFLAGQADAFTTLTFLCEPIERLRSQFDFDARLAAALGTAPPKEAEFLAQNVNPVCKFLIQRFPSLAGGEGSLAERALRVLMAFDHVLPHGAVRQGFQAASEALGGAPLSAFWLGRIPRENAGTGIAWLRNSDQLLRELNADDLALYAAFEQARRQRPSAANPLASASERARLAALVAQPFAPERHIDHIAESLALELVMSRGADEVQRRCLELTGLAHACLHEGLARIGVVSRLPSAQSA